ncbi:3-hydroxyacyl-CoA dehydrogenase [Rhodanobacter sp. ANJX3]|uniref:3-hydroxyacyl-CoA dehydrogenase NAD-binding domain-containing protein n=1 Tax=unclassified Rhodanobacter TaxID=2621553 RepID=UPI0015C8D7D8|nr:MULTISPECIES: 3-hydroxyacyl-CoA dehydrogenase NAD-binding domain-containing protein [unclassified Rhodanobacter]MBB5357476.1 3-hydroxyacyl-CoA dehydrogenase [Rhodanobacter sp. ANJX3]NYE27525.1 3-hydroxyacyl-CoA dehydrogenase [Rhodanobacter sp. K2T2]
MTSPIKRVAIVGTGVIGASWAAAFLASGLDVSANDVAPGAEVRLRKYISEAWPALEQLGLAKDASRERLTFSGDLETAVKSADLVQENGPEKIEFKRGLYEHLDALLDANVIIASSSSGLTMGSIQSACTKHPERCVIGHPFNPPHLIPLVEIVGGALTSEDTIERATRFYRSLGKKTIRLRKEVPGHVANRLQAALFREVVHLIAEGVVSVEDADAAVSWGPGLRWGVMGPTMLFNLGGGEGGIAHFLEQFTGPMNALWSALGSPVLTPELCAMIAQGATEELHNRPFAQLVSERDEVLLGLLALRNQEFVAP